MIPVTLRTTRLVLDEVRPGDVDRVLEYCEDPEVQRWIPLPSPYLREHAEFFTGPYPATAGMYLWALRARAGGPLMGALELQPENPLGTIGFWLGARHRGQGYMAEALTSVVDHAFTDLGMERIGWEAIVGNTSSAVVARKVGFTFRGTDEGALDVRGTRRDAWRADLLRGDPRDEKPGWPA